MICKKTHWAIVRTQLPGHHSQCANVVTPRAAVRTQMPGCHSFSALSAANIQKNPLLPTKVTDFFYVSLSFQISTVDFPDSSPQQTINHPKCVLAFLLAHPYPTRMESAHKFLLSQTAAPRQSAIHNPQHVFRRRRLIDICLAQHARDMPALERITHNLTIYI